MVSACNILWFVNCFHLGSESLCMQLVIEVDLRVFDDKSWTYILIDLSMLQYQKPMGMDYKPYNLKQVKKLGNLL